MSMVDASALCASKPWSIFSVCKTLRGQHPLNGDGECTQYSVDVVYCLPTDGLMAQASWPSPKVGGHMALFLHSFRELGEHPNALSVSSVHLMNV